VGKVADKMANITGYIVRELNYGTGYDPLAERFNYYASWDAATFAAESMAVALESTEGFEMERNNLNKEDCLPSGAYAERVEENRNVTHVIAIHILCNTEKVRAPEFTCCKGGCDLPNKFEVHRDNIDGNPEWKVYAYCLKHNFEHREARTIMNPETDDDFDAENGRAFQSVQDRNLEEMGFFDRKPREARADPEGDAPGPIPVRSETGTLLADEYVEVCRFCFSDVRPLHKGRCWRCRMGRRGHCDE
jgi:hypothetical protein